jgi:uncharacterized membrane protein YjgN (DUF898 family)
MTATAISQLLPGQAVAVGAEGVKPGAEAAPAHRFEFTGDGREFFGIWIVNILLSVVTLGIYSAWAKVRSKRYFYSHTLLAGASFDYLARPMQILKGRLVVAAFFLAYLGLTRLTPWADLVVGLLMIPLAPWVVVRALSFSRRYTSWRNLRFGFDGGKKEAFGVFVLLPVAAVVSLGLLHPYSMYRRRQFLVEHSRYGRTPFAFDGTRAGYFRIYLVATALLVVAVALAAALGLGAAAALTGAADVTSNVFKIVFGGALAVGALAVYIHLAARRENYAWSHTRLDADRFRLELQIGALYRIYLINVTLIVLTVGLAIPWAKVRLACYRLSRLSLLAAGDLDRHLAGADGQMAALGQEFGDALDLDLGM